LPLLFQTAKHLDVGLDVFRFFVAGGQAFVSRNIELGEFLTQFLFLISEGYFYRSLDVVGPLSRTT